MEAVIRSCDRSSAPGKSLMSKTSSQSCAGDPRFERRVARFSRWAAGRSPRQRGHGPYGAGAAGGGIYHYGRRCRARPAPVLPRTGDMLHGLQLYSILARQSGFHHAGSAATLVTASLFFTGPFVIRADPTGTAQPIDLFGICCASLKI